MKKSVDALIGYRFRGANQPAKQVSCTASSSISDLRNQASETNTPTLSEISLIIQDLDRLLASSGSIHMSKKGREQSENSTKATSLESESNIEELYTTSKASSGSNQKNYTTRRRPQKI